MHTVTLKGTKITLRNGFISIFLQGKVTKKKKKKNQKTDKRTIVRSSALSLHLPLNT